MCLLKTKFYLFAIGCLIGKKASIIISEVLNTIININTFFIQNYSPLYIVKNRTQRGDDVYSVELHIR